MSAIAAAYGEGVSLQLAPLLGPILSLPLSAELLHTLAVIDASVPSIAAPIASRALDLLCTIIAGDTWARLTAPHHLGPRASELLVQPGLHAATRDSARDSAVSQVPARNTRNHLVTTVCDHRV